MQDKAKFGDLHVMNGSQEFDPYRQAGKRRRWDQSAEAAPTTPKKKSSWDAAESSTVTPSESRWDETPGKAKGGETPGGGATPSARQWDATPGHATPGASTPGRDVTPGHQASARKNRWDETPKASGEILLLLLCNHRCLWMTFRGASAVCVRRTS